MTLKPPEAAAAAKIKSVDQETAELYNSLIHLVRSALGDPHQPTAHFRVIVDAQTPHGRLEQLWINPKNQQAWFGVPTIRRLVLTPA